MEDLSLHVLDVAENSLAAQARSIEISIEEDSARGRMRLVISDDGRGMDPETVDKVRDPFYTTRTTRRVGLGLPLLEAAARQTEGEFKVESRPGEGTRVTAVFRSDHIDHKPLGDMAQTIATLVMGHSDVEIRYTHVIDGQPFIFDTREIRSRLNGTPIHSPRVIQYIRAFIEGGIDHLRRKP